MNVGTQTDMGVFPHFIKASSAEKLQEALLMNNIRLKSEVKYFDIQFADGYWFAWYYDKVDLYSKIKPKGK